MPINASIRATPYYSVIKMAGQTVGQRCSLTALNTALRRSTGITRSKTGTDVIQPGSFTVSVRGINIEIAVLELKTNLNKENDIFGFDILCQYPMATRQFAHRREIFEAIGLHIIIDFRGMVPAAKCEAIVTHVPGHKVDNDGVMWETCLLAGSVTAPHGFTR